MYHGVLISIQSHQFGIIVNNRFLNILKNGMELGIWGGGILICDDKTGCH